MPTWLIVVLVVLSVLASAARSPGESPALARTRGLLRRSPRAGSIATSPPRGQDRGWDPERLEAAARERVGPGAPGVGARGLMLLEVLDRPGTDADKAIFRFAPAPRGLEHRAAMGAADR